MFPPNGHALGAKAMLYSDHTLRDNWPLADQQPITIPCIYLETGDPS